MQWMRAIPPKGFALFLRSLYESAYGSRQLLPPRTLVVTAARRNLGKGTGYANLDPRWSMKEKTSRKSVVGVTGFEPATPTSRT
jgi:hypothetical protein